MIDLKRSKKGRSKKALFNPYKNGITTYDIAYLSSKGIQKNKNICLQNEYIDENIGDENIAA